MNKKGISLVALVITIIVLIILTAAVIITGVNTPQGAQQAVEGYNLATVQDAVTLYILNHMSANATAATLPTTADAIATIYNTSTKVWTKNAAASLSLSGVDLTKYILDATGKVTAGTSTVAAV